MTKQHSLTAEEVESYLQQHPDFFNKHLHLLEKMRIPHPSGDAVSLISKQLEIFRSKHHEQENQLMTLIEIARDNDIACMRMHKLTLALLDAATLEDVINHLNIVLSDYFLTDFVALRIIKSNATSTIPDLFIDSDPKSLKPFATELGSNQPSCGRPTLTQAKALFGDCALEVRSCVIIPMLFTQLEGILAIGSRQEGRFQNGMGSILLTQMSEIIATRLISLIPRD
ncbi:DUF484 family protein [Crenothrix polyspora]|jgi:uncharacterized protein|uniref:Phytochrome sensor protein n=1 Tax=Crenothrix polyspora TaxID=360316 RepID=A0A1R4HCG6_9GAMM|nr:DUF484 family protein [Crenothrix polyspora]SJM93938.1 conserved hypothetical protein [Crenothrix polyspora]